MYFNVNFNVFFKLIKMHLLVSELYIYQNARCNDKINYILLVPLIGNLRILAAVNNNVRVSIFFRIGRLLTFRINVLLYFLHCRRA